MRNFYRDYLTLPATRCLRYLATDSTHSRNCGSVGVDNEDRTHIIGLEGRGTTIIPYPHNCRFHSFKAVKRTQKPLVKKQDGLKILFTRLCQLAYSLMMREVGFEPTYTGSLIPIYFSSNKLLYPS